MFELLEITEKSETAKIREQKVLQLASMST